MDPDRLWPGALKRKRFVPLRAARRVGRMPPLLQSAALSASLLVLSWIASALHLV